MWHLAELVAALLLFGAPPDDAGDQQLVEEAAPPTAFDGSKIATSVTESRREIEALASDTEPPAALDELESDLAEVDEELRLLESEHSDLELAAMPEIDSARESYRALERRLDEWAEIVEAETGELQAAQSRITEIEEDWRTAAADPSHPPAVATTIVEFRAELADARETTRERLDRVLTLQTEVAAYQTRVDEEVALLQQLSEGARAQLLLRDSPALWEADSTEASQTLDQLVDRESRRFLAYAGAHRARLIFVAVLLGLVVAGSRRLGAGDRRRRGLEAATLGAVAVYLAFVGGYAVLAYAGVLVGAFPVLAIGLQQAPRKLRSLLAVAAALAAVSVGVRVLGPALPGLRYILFALGVSALVVSALAARNIHENQVVRRALIAATALLGVGAVAVLFGFRALGELLVVSTLLVALIGAELAVGTRALAAWLRTSQAETTPSEPAEQPVPPILVIVSALVWLWAATHAFGVWWLIYETGSSWLGTPLEIANLHIEAGDILAFGLVLVISIRASSFIGKTLEDRILPATGVSRGAAGAVSLLVRVGLTSLGIAFALAAAGVAADRITLVAGALSVGIGFGLQNVVNNFVSGIILVFERPVQVGDTVDVGGVLGEIKRIGIRSSTIRTLQGSEVIVPNAHFVSNEVTNWTLSDAMRRVDILVGVSYDADPRQVSDLLLGVATENPDVLTDPPPRALHVAFGESSLDFELRVWTSDFDGWRVLQSELNTRVLEVLRAADIEIPFPQRDVNLKGEVAPPPSR